MNQQFIINSNEACCGEGCLEEDILSVEKDIDDNIIVSLTENEINSYCRFHKSYGNKMKLVIGKEDKEEFINYLKNIIQKLEN